MGGKQKRKRKCIQGLKHPPGTITTETISSVTKEGFPPPTSPQPDSIPSTAASLSIEPRSKKIPKSPAVWDHPLVPLPYPALPKVNEGQIIDLRSVVMLITTVILMGR